MTDSDRGAVQQPDEEERRDLRRTGKGHSRESHETDPAPLLQPGLHRVPRLLRLVHGREEEHC